MKKFLVTACSILILFCLFTVAFHWYFRPSRFRQKVDEKPWKSVMAELKDDNAAKYYLQACEVLDDSGFNESLFKRYDDVLENGWRREDPAVESYLKKNEPALELVHKGTQQRFCSMPIVDSGQDVPYFAGFREIARIMVIKGGLLVWREKYAEAGRVYSDLLRFSADVSDSGIILHSLVGMAIEGLAYKGGESFLAQLNDEAVCNALLGQMIDIESRRVPLYQILEKDFAHRLKRYQKESGRVFLYYDRFSRQLLDRPKIVEFFVCPMRRVRNYLMFRLFKRRYLQETQRFGRYIIELSKTPYPEIHREKLNEKIPENELSQLAFGLIPDFLFLVTRQQTAQRANIIRVALHLHLLKSGTYPEKLDELAALMPKEALIDPFSTGQFIYRRTDDGYLLYSVGGNMKDDGGMQAKPPLSKETHGDFVFRTPQFVASSPPS